jgi:hypothetical protein
MCPTGLICKDRVAILIANVSWCYLISNSLKFKHHFIDERSKEQMKIAGKDFVQLPLYFSAFFDAC